MNTEEYSDEEESNHLLHREYQDDFGRDIEHIKQTLICLAIGCYVNKIS